MGRQSAYSLTVFMTSKKSVAAKTRALGNLIVSPIALKKILDELAE